MNTDSKLLTEGATTNNAVIRSTVPQNRSEPEKQDSQDSGGCVFGSIQKGVTLSGGITAGRYVYKGAVSRSSQCADMCCASVRCDLAFLVMKRCYLVSCYGESLCNTVHAKPSPYLTSVIFVNRLNHRSSVKSPSGLLEEVYKKFKKTSPTTTTTSTTTKVFSISFFH